MYYTNNTYTFSCIVHTYFLFEVITPVMSIQTILHLYAGDSNKG